MIKHANDLVFILTLLLLEVDFTGENLNGSIWIKWVNGSSVSSRVDSAESGYRNRRFGKRHRRQYTTHTFCYMSIMKNILILSTLTFPDLVKLQKITYNQSIDNEAYANRRRATRYNNSTCHNIYMIQYHFKLTDDTFCVLLANSRTLIESICVWERGEATEVVTMKIITEKRKNKTTIDFFKNNRFSAYAGTQFFFCARLLPL